MKLLFYFISINLIVFSGFLKLKKNRIEGFYQSTRGISSGIKINKDSTYCGFSEISLSWYYDLGTWSIKGDTILFKSLRLNEDSLKIKVIFNSIDSIASGVKFRVIPSDFQLIDFGNIRISSLITDSFHLKKTPKSVQYIFDDRESNIIKIKNSDFNYMEIYADLPPFFSDYDGTGTNEVKLLYKKNMIGSLKKTNKEHFRFIDYLDRLFKENNKNIIFKQKYQRYFQL